ncbi:glycosyltransferase family 1 protein [Gemmatimonas aurantiaca]|uniref:glycosyltransferase family 4 protein n=1 Tax=Gemmatimonas aurantiaca TaxID=173480 RepID=UPI00301DD532
MRLLVCTDTYPPLVNGVSVVTALTVAGLRRRGWDCLVLTPGAENVVSSREAVVDGVVALPAVAWRTYPDVRAAFGERRTVRAFVKSFRPDLVHCPTEFVLGWYGRQEALRAGVPYCTSYHTDFSRYTSSWGVPWLRRPVQSWIRHFHRRAARVYTPSLSARDDLRALGLRDIEVWGRGVDVDLFQPRRDVPTCSVTRPFRFLYVGRLAPEKNIGFLIEAFATVRARYPEMPMELQIVGDGPSRAALQRRAAQSGGPAVHFLGVQDREKDLPGIYAGADAFVYASTTETLGLVVLEAMAAGLSVVAVPAGGVAEHLRDEVNGLTYPADDHEACANAMSRLMQSPALRTRLAQGARRTAEQWSWDSELDRLDGSYREIVAESARDRRDDCEGVVDSSRAAHGRWSSR